MVVELRPEDIEQFTIDNLQFTISMQHDSAANCQLPTVNFQLSMMYFQEYLERLCCEMYNYLYICIHLYSDRNHSSDKISVIDRLII